MQNYTSTMVASCQPGEMQATPSNDSEWAAKSAMGSEPAAFSSQTETPSTAKLDDNQEDHGYQVDLTPGPQFPGAYPGPVNAPGVLTADDAKNAAIGVLHTAKQYIPAQQDVEKAMLNASEKAKQYLPNVVTSYFPLASFESSSDGKKDVAADMGCVHVADDQSRMASLNERPESTSHVPNDVDHDSTISRYNTGSQTLESNSITNLSTQAQAGSDIEDTLSSTTTPSVTPQLRPSSVSADTQLISKDSISGNAESALDPINDINSPQTTNREDVIPERSSDISSSEKATQTAEQPTRHLTPRIHPLAKQNANWKGVSLAESPGGSGGELNASVKASGGTPPIEHELEGSAMDHPVPSISPVVHQRDDSASANDSVTPHSNANSKIRGSPGSPSSSPRRSKFMDKIKGEVKMISGKLAHNEEKMEEGRRLMGKAE